MRIFSARGQGEKEKIMNKTTDKDEIKAEYRFDYSKARPNRFAEEHRRSSSLINLEADAAEVFPDFEPVNEALRFLARITRQNKTEIPQNK